MLNKKIITVGIIAVVMLVVVYLGNKAITTTPQSGALGNTQYKVTPIVDIAKQNILDSQKSIEDQLNKLSGEGWEYIGSIDIANSLVFRKN